MNPGTVIEVRSYTNIFKGRSLCTLSNFKDILENVRTVIEVHLLRNACRPF